MDEVGLVAFGRRLEAQLAVGGGGAVHEHDGRRHLAVVKHLRRGAGTGRGGERGRGGKVNRQQVRTQGVGGRQEDCRFRIDWHAQG